jgi:hypothetical protein
MRAGLVAAAGVVVGIAADILAFGWLNAHLAPVNCPPPQSGVLCVNFGASATYQAHFNMALGIGLAAGLLAAAAAWTAAAAIMQRRGKLAAP